MARAFERKLRLVIERRIKCGFSYGVIKNVEGDGSLDCHLEAVLVSLLGAIHGLVGLLYQPFRSERVVGIRGDAEGGGDARLQAGVPQEDVALDGLADA